MTKKYKVVVTVLGYPNGKLLKEVQRWFDTEVEALEYCKKNTWENPIQTSTATVYMFEAKTDWFPILVL